MSLERKLSFVFETTTCDLDDESAVPIAPDRRYCAGPRRNGGWGVFDRFHMRFLKASELRALTPTALIQDLSWRPN